VIDVITSDNEEVNVFARVCLTVCLSVCKQYYSKTSAWIWMKCCVSTDVGTWTNWLTFEPDPDFSPDAGTGLLSPLSCKRWYVEFYVWKIRRIYVSVAAATRSFTMVLFTEAVSSRNTFVGGRPYMCSTECPSSSIGNWTISFFKICLERAARFP